MDALAEANEDTREIDNAIRIGGDMALGIDIAEEEIEEELKALVEHIETDARTTRKLEQIQVPSTSPRVTETIESSKMPLLSH